MPIESRPVPRNVSLETIRAAAETVYQAAVRTPLIRLDVSGARNGAGPTIILKLETLQPIGSFKIRGAYNAVRKLRHDQLAKGVWTVSAGNAAQGVALAARHLNAACSVMVMDTAPETKLRAIARLGATTPAFLAVFGSTAALALMGVWVAGRLKGQADEAGDRPQ